MVILQGVIAQQAAAQGTIIGGAGLGTRPARPEDFPDEIDMVGGNRRRRPVFPPIPLLRTTENVGTNRHKDNKEDKDENKCILFAYKERKTKCPKGNAHHAIPDHCWRMGNSVYLSLGRAAAKMMPIPGKLGEAVADKAAQTFEESMVDAGRYYHPKMDKQEGLSICVEGAGKTLVHGAIHTLFDAEEKKLGEAGNPKWTAKLGDLEDKAAESMALETGCDKDDLKNQMRAYHQKKDLDEKKLLRADPFGKNTTSMTNFEIDPILKMKMPDHTGTGN
ncbi:hypothetical protein [Undibacterium sp. Xuan67W]|uniref:hypothetical protein n=1 Tax=Undibacterium sp. Xuan67W TaxID=3413057 RepID=UPI003BF314FD